MTKINREEYEILKGLDEKWKWIARDGKGGFYANKVHVYKMKPKKHEVDNEWADGLGCASLKEELFQFIRWEDSESWNIQELIEGYESEETEVKKDIEWLRKELVRREDNFVKLVENEQGVDYNSGKQVATRQAISLIDQLDEPEVLSQELPVIPQFVAEWIEEMKQDERPLYSIMSTLMNKTNHTWAVWKSAEKNFSEVVAQAWLDGFTVEEEQKYNVNIKAKSSSGTVGIFLYKQGGEVLSGDNFEAYNPKEDKYRLTEQEIKDYDKRLWPFRKPVEEVGENSKD